MENVNQCEMLTVNEACAIFGFKRTFLYERLSKGEIEAVKFGRTTRIPRAAIQTWIAGCRRLSKQGE